MKREVPWPKPPREKSKMRADQFSDAFVELMRRQSLHAYYRYGPTRANAASVDFAIEAAARLDAYFVRGNTELLVDVAVFAMCEFMYPHLEGARYAPDVRSPGLVSGVSSLEMAELNKENKL